MLSETSDLKWPEAAGLSTKETNSNLISVYTKLTDTASGQPTSFQPNFL